MESSLLAKGECYRSGIAEVRLGDSKSFTATHRRPADAEWKRLNNKGECMPGERDRYYPYIVPEVRFCCCLYRLAEEFLASMDTNDEIDSLVMEVRMWCTSGYAGDFF